MALGGCEKGEVKKEAPKVSSTQQDESLSAQNESVRKRLAESTFTIKQVLAEGQEIKFDAVPEIRYTPFFRVEKIGENTATINHGVEVDSNERSVIRVITAEYGVETRVFDNLPSPLLIVNKGNPPGTVELLLMYQSLL